MYGPIADDHLRHPRNLGKLEGADGVGQIDDLESETLLTIYLKLGDASTGERVVGAASFRAFGCGGCIITGSVATELATGRALDDVMAIDPAAIHRAIADGLPPDQRHCADLTVRALHLAVASVSRTVD